MSAGSESRQPDRDEPRRWRTQIHTIPAQVGPAIECYGLGIYPGPIAYLAMTVDGHTLDIGLLPGQVDALLNALKDARLCFEENGVPPVEVVESREPFPLDEDTEEEQRAEIADAAYMKGYADASGPPLSVDEIAERQEVWMPIERALVAQDRIAGPPEENRDPHITQAAQPEDVAREVLHAAEPKLRRAVLDAVSSHRDDEARERA